MLEDADIGHLTRNTRNAGAMIEHVTNRGLVFAVLAVFGNEARHRIVEMQQAALIA